MSAATTARVQLEWRVVVTHPGLDRPFYRDCDDEAEAREWAKYEQEDYPQSKITVESREVGPWKEVDGREAPCSTPQST